MKEQSEKTAQALEKALQMEIEGQEFYHKAEQKCTSPLTKKLFQHLAEQETVHMQKIKELYQKVTSAAGWPEAETAFKHEKSLRSVFKEAIESMDREVEASSDEIEALTKDSHEYGGYEL